MLGYNGVAHDGCKDHWHLSAKNEKGKMEFLVTVPVDDAQFEVLERRYQTLIG